MTITDVDLGGLQQQFADGKRCEWFDDDGPAAAEEPCGAPAVSFMPVTCGRCGYKGALWLCETHLEQASLVEFVAHCGCGNG